MFFSPTSWLTVGLCLLVEQNQAKDSNTIDHDAVRAIIDPVATAPGSLVARFQPLMDFADSGCAPFPAVNAIGQIGGGLKASGPPSSQCLTNRDHGQVYSRVVNFGAVWGIMYAWYFPKESRWLDEGHRHEWVNAVLWLDSKSDPNLGNEPIPSITSISYERNDGLYSKTKHWFATGTRPWLPKVYQGIDPSLHRQGFSQPLVDWDSMPTPALEALNSFYWGHLDSQRCPFNAANVEDFVTRAFNAPWTEDSVPSPSKKPEPRCIRCGKDSEEA